MATSARRGRARCGVSPLATLAAVAALVLALALFLEQWPGKRAAPAFAGAMAVAAPLAGDAAVPTPGSPAVLFMGGAASVREDEAILGPGPVDILLRASSPVPSLKVTVGGQGSVLRAAGLPPLVLRPTGALVDLPLAAYHEVRGRGGRAVLFCRTMLTVEGEAVLRVGEGPVSTPPESPPAAEGEMEPEPGGPR